MFTRLAERCRRGTKPAAASKRRKQSPPAALILPRMEEYPAVWSEGRQPKSSPITEDYEISNHVLGLGINGKVVQCYDRKNRQKYALKVYVVAIVSMWLPGITA